MTTAKHVGTAAGGGFFVSVITIWLLAGTWAGERSYDASPAEVLGALPVLAACALTFARWTRRAPPNGLAFFVLLGAGPVLGAVLGSVAFLVGKARVGTPELLIVTNVRFGPLHHAPAGLGEFVLGGTVWGTFGAVFSFFALAIPVWLGVFELPKD